jgi:FlaA1/EpsC-like NDP-sugar epimerase
MNKHSLVKIFKNKKILITGYTGFKGMRLCCLPSADAFCETFCMNAIQDSNL